MLQVSRALGSSKSAPGARKQRKQTAKGSLVQGASGVGGDGWGDDDWGAGASTPASGADGDWSGYDFDDDDDGSGETYEAYDGPDPYANQHDAEAAAKKKKYLDAVPAGKVKLEHFGEDCSNPCKYEREGHPAGYCNWCGKGNACCELRSAKAPPECSGVATEPFLDEWGLEQIGTYRCAYPKLSNVSNYQKAFDEAMQMAFAPPEDNSYVDRKPSPYPAPDLQFDKYARKEGKGKTKVYLKVGTVKDKTENYDALKHKDGECCLKKWEEACPAIGDKQYALKNKGLFDDFTYTTYPFMLAAGTEVQLPLFCGARYTDDPSNKTLKAAATLAEKACTAMGGKCGGFSVGADPECCGNTGCTETVFLSPLVKEHEDATSPEKRLVDKHPKSMKLGEYNCNYFTPGSSSERARARARLRAGRGAPKNEPRATCCRRPVRKEAK